MDEVRIVRHRTHIWPVIIAVIILAIVIGYVFFARSGPAQQVGWNAPTVAAPAVSAPAEDAI
jgi:hypothetical protein